MSDTISSPVFETNELSNEVDFSRLKFGPCGDIFTFSVENWSLNFAYMFFRLLIFFKSNFFQNYFGDTTRVLYSLDPDRTSGLIWFQIVCKSY